MRTWVIYTLEDPRNMGVRYVGVTHQEPTKRLCGHLSLAKKGAKYHLSNWISSLQREGFAPLMTIVDTGQGPGWGDAEIRWIQHYKDQGCDLTNATKGGEGCPGHTVSQEARQKMREAKQGKPLSAEHRAKVASGNIGKKMSPESIARSVSSRRGFRHSLESREKISMARRGTRMQSPSPELISRRSVSIRVSYAERKAAGLIPETSSETRTKISKALRGLKRSPETRARMSISRKAICARKREELGQELGHRNSHKACPVCGSLMHRQSKVCRSCYRAGRQA